ncbi:MAG: hypothetical protein HC855_16130 [Rhizobiales bacterium]|nr:hypothetical protein [Hyphomicrobiales bacterium]
MLAHRKLSLQARTEDGARFQNIEIDGDTDDGQGRPGVRGSPQPDDAWQPPLRFWRSSWRSPPPTRRS